MSYNDTVRRSIYLDISVIDCLPCQQRKYALKSKEVQTIVYKYYWIIYFVNHPVLDRLRNFGNLTCSSSSVFIIIKPK
jgi:hypothetical protein